MNVIPVEEVTQAIVTAAKRVRKTPVETTIVNQIVEGIQNGKFADEAAELLKTIFGTKFCVAKGLLAPEAKPKKERKPRKKVVVDADADADADAADGEQVNSQTPILNDDTQKDSIKEKKPRKKAVKPVKLAEVTEESTEDATEEPTKEKKPRKKPVKSVAPVVEETTEEATEEPTKEKKPRKKAVKPVAPVEVTEEPTKEATEEATEEPTKEKKPRKKAVKPVANDTEDGETQTQTSNEEPVKESKPRKRTVRTETVIQQGEVTMEDIIPITETANIDQLDISKKVIDQPLMDEWSEELVEEELSDIEPEED